MVRTITHMAYWLGLTLWIGAIMTAGIAAIGVFGTFRSLPVTLPDYAVYDATAHGRLAAGLAMERVFWMVDLVQFAAAPLVLIAMIVRGAFGHMTRSWPTWTAATCVVLACATLLWHMLIAAPPMNRELRAYWAAAKAGESDAARAHQQAFEADHVLAERLMQARLLVLLTALVAAAAGEAHQGGRTSHPRPQAIQMPQPVRPR
jgi:hypothetical protein